ncbi:MAG: aldehyde ferredoxin oxidoreductase family protein [Rhodospirillales bacterium]|nr:aldehyde ferredoxin oxidoreductase family protein [Rhodospirillales bacterium]
MTWHGYAGKILEVDLSAGTVGIRDLPRNLAVNFLGGKGFGAKILSERLPPGCDPLGEDNMLVFATGTLTGTMVPTSGRMEVCTKSPATGLWLDSNCGGSLGPELKYAGFDAVVITGRAASPVMLAIRNGEAALVDARDLWGLDAIETHKELKRRYSTDHKIACVGQAGERLSPIAGILSEYRIFGRGGAGAVMGSKNLKAIVALGQGAISIADPDEFDRLMRESLNEISNNPDTGSARPEFGTNVILSLMDYVGVHPVRNFSGFSPETESINEQQVAKFFERHRACMSCTIRCSKIARVEEGPLKGAFTEGPEYETVWSFGAQCGNTDIATIIEAEHLCDAYGLDAVSAGNVIGFLIECAQRGLLSKEDAGGLDLSWGEGEAIIAALHLIGKCEGPGELWSQGVKRIAEEIPGSEDFAAHVKGLELPAYDPRASKGMSLAYATSDRGGCHLRAWPVADEVMNSMGLQTAEFKAEIVKTQQDMFCMANCSGLCLFATFAMSLEQITPLFHCTTGLDEFASADHLLEAGERINNLVRLFNLREGLTRGMDSLPGRFLKEPLAGGPLKGCVADVEPLLDTYYKVRGWDNDGVPAPALLARLGLEGALGA